MPAWLVPALLGGASFLGGLFGNKQKGRQAATSTQTVTPQLSPAGTELQNLLMTLQRQRLGSTAPLAGYEATGLQDINRSYSAVQQALENDLTRRGLASSPAGAAAARNIGLARAGDISRFESSLPLLQRELQGQDIQSGLRMYGLMPRGQTITGQTTGDWSGTYGGGIGGGLNDIGTMLGYLYGMGSFGNKTTKPSSLQQQTAAYPGGYWE